MKNPNEIKSQDDVTVNQGGRSSDVLVTTMKTPEELTADWNAGKLEQGWYYVKFADEIYPDYFNSYFIQTGDKCDIEILAPVLTYDEYKAIQEELAEHRHYCCCMENEVMRLDKAKLEEEIAKLKEKIKKKEELIQCLGSNIDELDVKKWFLSLKTTSSADC